MRQAPGKASGSLPADPLKKKLDKTLADVDLGQPASSNASKKPKDYWEKVHCNVCMIDYNKDDLADAMGGLLSCPECNMNTLKPGEFFRSPDQARVRTGEVGRSTSEKRTPPRGPHKNDEVPTRPTSVPP